MKWTESDKRHQAAFRAPADGVDPVRPAEAISSGRRTGRLQRAGRCFPQAGRTRWSPSFRRRRCGGRSTSTADAGCSMQPSALTAAATAGVGMLGWLSAEHRRWTYFETAVGGNRRAQLEDRSQAVLEYRQPPESAPRQRTARQRSSSAAKRCSPFPGQTPALFMSRLPTP